MQSNVHKRKHFLQNERLVDLDAADGLPQGEQAIMLWASCLRRLASQNTQNVGKLSILWFLKIAVSLDAHQILLAH